MAHNSRQKSIWPDYFEMDFYKSKTTLHAREGLQLMMKIIYQIYQIE